MIICLVTGRIGKVDKKFKSERLMDLVNIMR